MESPPVAVLFFVCAGFSLAQEPALEDGAGCDTYLKPLGDGFEGRTLEGMCQNVFQNPVPGSWSFRTEPGSIVVKNVRSGETLRFRRIRS